MKNRIIIFLLGLHLLIIYAGTSIFDFERIPVALMRPVSYYLALVGGHDYSFFSPDIPTQVLVRCSVIYSDGHSELVNFDQVNNTYQLRTNYLFQTMDDAGGHETAAAIAAHYCFKLYPQAQKVKVSIERFEVSTVQNIKSGKKPYDLDELFTQTYMHE